MVASRRVMDRFSAEGPSEADLARIDAHVIQPHEYEEIPELTDEMMERAIFSRNSAELDIAVQALTRPVLKLETDVAEALRATGSGWEERGNAALREWLRTRSA